MFFVVSAGEGGSLSPPPLGVRHVPARQPLSCPTCPGEKRPEDFRASSWRGSKREQVCKRCSNRKSAERKRARRRRKVLREVGIEA